MTVTVYVWRYRKLGLIGIGNVGHTSLRVDSATGASDFYLSWWPGGDKASVKDLFTRHSKGHSSPGRYNSPRNPQATVIYDPSQSDKAWEDRAADAKYRFNLNGAKLLNETRMWAAFNALDRGTMVLTTKHRKSVKGGQYSLLHQNCSDAVAAILEAGGATQYVAKPKMRFVWTPTDVAKWCDQLVSAMVLEQPGSAKRARGFTEVECDFTHTGWQYSALGTCS